MTESASLTKEMFLYFLDIPTARFVDASVHQLHRWSTSSAWSTTWEEWIFLATSAFFFQMMRTTVKGHTGLHIVYRMGDSAEAASTVPLKGDKDKWVRKSDL